MLHRTINQWKKSKETDLRKFCSRLDVKVPYSTLQKYLCNDKSKRHSPPYHIWRNTSLISVDEYDSLVTECVLGLVAQNPKSLSIRLITITRDRLTQEQVQTEVCPMVLKEVKFILAQPFSPDFSRYLYFQETNTNNHGLNQYNPTEQKAPFRHHTGLYGIVTREFQIAMGRQGIYIVNNLHSTPHGDDDVDTMSDIDDVASTNDVLICKVPAGLHRCLMPNLKVFRGAAHEMFHPSIIHFPQQALFDYVIASVKPEPSSRHESLAYVIDFGFNQPQPRSSKKIVHHTGVLLPHFKSQGRPFLVNMPENLRRQFGDMVVYVQDLITAHHPDTMQDDLRRDTYAPIWNEYGFPDHEILFEYINIIIKPEMGNTLLNHMDYMNDNRTGYTHCSVLWYLTKWKEIQYRVAIVMTFRYHCGAQITNIRNKLNEAI